MRIEPAKKSGCARSNYVARQHRLSYIAASFRHPDMLKQITHHHIDKLDTLRQKLRATSPIGMAIWKQAHTYAKTKNNVSIKRHFAVKPVYQTLNKPRTLTVIYSTFSLLNKVLSTLSTVILLCEPRTLNSHDTMSSSTFN